MKRFFTAILSGVLVLNFCGCAALLVGAAGGVGTAAWLSGKLTEEVNVPKDSSVDAVKSTLISMNLPLTSQESQDDVDRIRSLYPDGRKIWIDVFRLPQGRSRLEIRIGMMGDKTASEVMLRKIADKLGISP